MLCMYNTKRCYPLCQKQKFTSELTIWTRGKNRSPEHRFVGTKTDSSLERVSPSLSVNPTILFFSVRRLDKDENYAPER